jgi:hypothetical protein
MSPEQARDAILDGRSDLYSLGMVFYEILTGTNPRQNFSNIALLQMLGAAETMPPLKFPSTIPVEIQQVVKDLLQYNPAVRIKDAETLIIRLEELYWILNQSNTETYPDATIALNQIQQPDLPLDKTVAILQTTSSPISSQTRKPGIEAANLSAKAKAAAEFPMRQDVEAEAPHKAKGPAEVRDQHEDERCWIERVYPTTKAQSDQKIETIEKFKHRAAKKYALFSIIILVLGGTGYYTFVIKSSGGHEELGSHDIQTQPEIEPVKPKNGSSKPIPTPIITYKELGEIKSQGEVVAQVPQEGEARRLAAEEERRKQEAEARRLAAEEERRQQEETRRLAAEEERRKQEVARRLAVEEEQRQQESEARRLASEEDRRKQEAEARRLAAEEERGQQEEARRLAAKEVLQTKNLLTLVEKLQRSMVERDLATIEQISSLSASRRRMLQELFTTYKTIEVSIDEIKENSDGATVNLLIIKLGRPNGEQVLPSPILKKTKVLIPKNGDNWGSFIW